MSEAATAHPLSTEGQRAKSLGKAPSMASLLNRALTESDTPHTEVAEAWGCNRSYVGHICSGRKPLTAWRIAALPERSRRTFLKLWGAQMGAAFVPLPDAPDDKPGACERGARLADEHGEAMGAYMRAVADGVLTAGEASEVEREMWDAVYEKLGVIALCRLAQSEGVVGVE